MLSHLPKVIALSGGLDRFFMVAFWSSIAVVFYTYLGYPIFLWMISRFRSSQVPAPSTLPTISLLICAHNEAQNIAGKLTDTLALNYPQDRLQILVASDGSTDDTVAIVRSFASRGVDLIVIPQQAGKTNAQNIAVRHATGDLVVFSDATTQYQADALQYIAGNFADPSVGAVSGRYCYTDPGTSAATSSGATAFADYDNRIRKLQSDIQSLTGCCGCIYAVRRLLYTPLPPNIISDLVEPLHILLAGSKVKLESRAIAWEATPDTTRKEFSMRVRVVARALHGLSTVPRLLTPWRYPWIAFQLYSHKVLRFSVPLFLLGIFFSSFLLSHLLFYQAVFLAQFALYGSALLVALVPSQKLAKPFRLPLYFCIVNAAALSGLFQFVRGKRYTSWRPERTVFHAR